MNQRWKIDVEPTWISSRGPTVRRYFNIYQCWINVQCLQGALIISNREIKYVMEIIKNLAVSGLLNEGVRKTIDNEVK